MRAILHDMREVTSNINTIVAQNDQKINAVVDNLKNASGEMEKTFTALSQVVEGVQKGEGTIGQLLKDKDTADKLNKTVSALQGVSEKINEGKGTFGKLINDEETAKNLEFSGYPSFVEKIPMKGGDWYTVRIGHYASRDDAKKAVMSFAEQLQAHYVIDKVRSK